MSIPNKPISLILDKHNQPYCDAVFVVVSVCAHCKQPFSDEVAIALGAPFHCLVHETCAPYFNYLEKKWAHAKPLSSYLSR